VTRVTIATPPGWYPEPGHEGNGPALERWWDGNEWTEYTRTAQAGIPGPGGAGYPDYPGYPGYSGDVVAGGSSGPGRQRGKAAIGIIAALVVVGGVVGGVIALNSGNSSGTTADPGPSASATAPGGLGPGQEGGNGGLGGSGGGFGGPSAQPSAPSTTDPGVSVDALDGISLPVPAGWTGQTTTDGLANVEIGTYACPGDATQKCSRGGAFSVPAAAVKITATTAEGAAKQDISQNAAESYSKATYGGITSHKVLKSQKVTVAGQQGYLVRWQVVTKLGDDGYVQSVVFPSPASSSNLVVVRYGFDINAKAPKLSVMDEITKGIKVSGTTSGTGV
jgi:hypothetical protein